MREGLGHRLHRLVPNPELVTMAILCLSLGQGSACTVDSSVCALAAVGQRNSDPFTKSLYILKQAFKIFWLGALNLGLHACLTSAVSLRHVHGIG